MDLGKHDIGIKVSPKGVTEVMIPNTEELSGKSIRAMLKEIRNLEVAFTELANDTYEDDDAQCVEGDVQ